MGVKVEIFSIEVLLSRCRVIDKSGIRTLQCRLAFHRALSCRLGTPAQQNFTQIPDSDIHCGSQINIAVSAIVHAIVAESQYFGAHASLPNHPLAQWRPAVNEP
jgi:hypothetical protein